ncbi:MAG: FGGY family carbohydrate kinase [bacterium]
MDIILGIDIGTSKLCVIAMELNTGNVLSNISTKNISNLKSNEQDIKEQSPDIIYSQTIELIKRICGKLKIKRNNIRGIGITCQMHGVLLIDTDNKPATPLITWQDSRCKRSMRNGKTYIRYISDIIDNDVFFEDCGTLPAAGFGGMTLFWLKENNLIPSDAKAVTIGDYISIKLSDGQSTIDETNAASFGIYNIKTHTWHNEIIKSLGLPSGLFPEIGNSGEPIGNITSDIAKLTNLPKHTKICRCIGDNQASFIGAVSNIENGVLLNIGTGSQISCPLKNFKTYKGLDTRPLVNNRYIAVGAGLCGGEAYTYLKNFISDIGENFFYTSKSESELFAKMNELAIMPDKDLALYVNTNFMGTRLNPDLKGRIENIDIKNFSISNLCRGFLDGIVNELVDFYRICSKDVETTDIVGSGNALRRNNLLNEIISEKFKHRVKTPLHTEEAAYGAALSAGVGLGFFKSYKEAGGIIKYHNK